MATISRTGISGGGTIQPAHITNIIDALDGTSATTTIVATGSFTGSLVGTLTGTATSATTANTATNATNTAVTNTSTGTGPYYITFVESATGNVGQRVDATGLTYNATTDTITATASFATTALSASYAANVPVTASYALSALSSSYAVTASYALNAGGGTGVGFPYTGSAIISGSLVVTGSAVANVNAVSILGSVYVDNTATGALNGRITGNGNLRLDLSELGTSGSTGFLNIPIFQPAGPDAGSIYWDDENNTLWIYSAANADWYQVTLTL
jgi:hypothetical protein